MSDLAAIANDWKRKKRECKAIIETPKGRRNKFDYDPKSRLFQLGGLLPEGLAFPFDFGFIPSTLGDDGDPLDVMVLMDEPAHVGCLLDIRIIGVIEAVQAQGGKARQIIVSSLWPSTPTIMESFHPSMKLTPRCSIKSRNSSSRTTRAEVRNSRSKDGTGRNAPRNCWKLECERFKKRSRERVNCNRPESPYLPRKRNTISMIRMITTMASRTKLRASRKSFTMNS